jgi:hypothetical protein
MAKVRALNCSKVIREMSKIKKLLVKYGKF